MTSASRPLLPDSVAAADVPATPAQRSFSAPFRINPSPGSTFANGHLGSDLDPPTTRRATVIRVIGLSLLALFLYLSISSIISSRPSTSPGRRTGMEMAVGRILDDTLTTPLVFDRLAEMTDLFGPRPAGSEGLEQSIDWMITTMRNDGLKVWTENVTVDYWRRGPESLTLHIPSRQPLTIPLLGLGGSVSTPIGGISADVIVAEDFEELQELGREKIAGKVVLLDPVWHDYGSYVKYRFNGAKEAEKYGAVAVLLRSATPFSLRTPHTGYMSPSSIPAAAIAIEDADMIHRMYRRHLTSAGSTSSYSHLFAAPHVQLHMNSTILRNRTTRNVVAEIRGQTRPNEIVLFGGHIDSWDVGAGAVDDGGGVFTAWHALRAIARQGQPPSRTVRMVAWVAEETGGAGSKAYFAAHRNERHIFAMESDNGAFKPWGLMFSGSRGAGRRLSEVGQKYLYHIDAGHLMEVGNAGAADIEPLCARGVPCASFTPYDPVTKASPGSDSLDGYFYYHHSAADTMSVLKPDELSTSAAAMAVWAYVVADMDDSLMDL